MMPEDSVYMTIVYGHPDIDSNVEGFLVAGRITALWGDGRSPDDS